LYLNYQQGPLKISVRIGTQEPNSGKILGDIIYAHGFSDRLDNHGPLFEAWNEAGFRVIALDLPGHGENKGNWNNINMWSMLDFANLIALVEKKTASQDQSRPLILAGWSTGGLVVTRMLQSKLMPKLTRKVAGLILFAPGIAVRKPWDLADKTPDYARGVIGHVTTKSLTHDPKPPHNGPIFPRSPVVQAAFGAMLITNSLLSQKENLPSDLPVLILTAGDKEDLYADEARVKQWIASQKPRMSKLVHIDCAQGRHELDNELEPMGETVRQAAAVFASNVVLNPSDVAQDVASLRCEF
jgi:alpha-beta hydrolase superfamily lysophospholipase